MARTRRRLIIGVGGHAVAVDAATGEEAWRTKLKSSSYVTVRESTDRVYAGAGGELFCLDKANGRLLWRNKLKGLGLGLVAFAGDDDLAAAAASEAAARAAAAAS
jgi:outer membrane protein assembly factor BamB